MKAAREREHKEDAQSQDLSEVKSISLVADNKWEINLWHIFQDFFLPLSAIFHALTE